MKSEVYNIDCMQYMESLPDNYFDLAIIDPPYGLGEDGLSNHNRGCKAIAKKYKISTWDKTPVKKNILEEVIRVSKNQIFWGANHYISRIPFDSSCWLVWDKDNGKTDFADCEIAYTSFKTAIRKFKFKWQGMIQGNMKNKEIRIHPTQKPIALYKWILKNYAKPGNLIFDSHLGSGSSRIAAYDLGFDFYGTELDIDYFNDSQERFKNHVANGSLFCAEEINDLVFNGQNK